MKKHKPLFDEGCSELLDQINEAKLQWLQDSSEISGDDLNNVRREARQHVRNKKKEYPKDKIIELAANSKNKNIRDLYRGIKAFKSDYRPRSNLVLHVNGICLQIRSLNEFRLYQFVVLVVL
jgi:hypothetical protein